MKKLVGTILLMAAATLVVVFAIGTQETMAQEDPSEDNCPPERCSAGPTTEEEDTRGTCVCNEYYNSNCHYEYVPAFACLPRRHEDNSTTTEEWYSMTYGGSWGLKKYDSNSNQLELRCPIPADKGVDSVKNYANLGGVVGYFYHYSALLASTMCIYTATSGGTTYYHGCHQNVYSGQQEISIQTAATRYEFWYAEIGVSNHQSSTFHGLRVCYDPD